MDGLLEWMSYRKSGGKNSVREFLRDRESESLALYRLSVLGHVERDAEHRWRIAPPVLAGSSGQNGSSSVLCGARTPALLRRLRSACSNAGATCRETEQAVGPAVITVHTEGPDRMREVADQSAIPLQDDAAFTMLACLPEIREWSGRPCEMVAGRVVSVHRFSRSKLRWEASSIDAANAARRGLFRVKRDRDTVTILKRSPSDLVEMEPAAGRFWIAARRRLIRWDSGSLRFSFPRALFPPLLIARALTICTGAFPERDANSSAIFREVPESTARLAISLSGLRLA